MRRLRHNGKWASRLALFALGLQLILSFGHVHTVNPFATASFANGVAVAADAASGHRSDHHGPSDRQHGNHDDCALCAAAQLAGNLVLAPPLVMPLPESPALAWDTPPAAHFASLHVAHFQARAPPSV